MNLIILCETHFQSLIFTLCLSNDRVNVKKCSKHFSIKKKLYNFKYSQQFSIADEKKNTLNLNQLSRQK